MKLLKFITFYIASLLLFSACGGAIPKPIHQRIIDESLEKIVLTKKGVFVGMKSIAFEWKSLQDSRIEGIYVYKRSLSAKSKKSSLNYYATINNRFATHFVDTKIEPNTKYEYAFRTFANEKESDIVKVFHVESLPVFESVSWIHSITGMPRSAKIIWRPHGNEKVISYIIERKNPDEKEFRKIAVVEGRLNAEFIDKNLKDKRLYTYRVRVKTYDNIISQVSREVQVLTKPLPSGVEEIITSHNAPKKIYLSWSKSQEKDFYQYYVYRALNEEGGYRLIATLYNNLFTDHIKQDGKRYFYRVSVVDKDGLESIYDRLSVAGKTLEKPQAPKKVNAYLQGNNVLLKWNVVDERSVEYVVRKRYKDGWFKEITKDFKEIKEKMFLDSDIQKEKRYTYIVYAVDKFGIVSKGSQEIEIDPQNAKQVNQVKMQQKQESIETEIFSLEDKTLKQEVPKKKMQGIVVPKQEKKMQKVEVSPVLDFDLNGL